MDMASGGQLFAEALRAHGVDHIFTLCGGHIAPIYLAAEAMGARIVDLRHEQAAVMAADGYARAARKPGVALITAGPGVTNGFTGIVNAQLAGSPVVVIGGQSQFANFEMGALQEMSHLPFLTPVTRWCRGIVDPKRIPDYVSMAFRHAQSGSRGVSFIEAPMDLLMAPAERQPSLPSYVKAESWPDPRDVEQLAWMLRIAERPVLLAGSQVYWDEAWDELDAFARESGLPVFVNGQGRGTLRPDHPNFLQHSRSQAMRRADLVILLGAPLDFRLGYGRPPKLNAEARVIQVDSDPARLGQNRTPDIGFTCSTRALLSELRKALETDRGRSPLDWLAELQALESKELEALAEKGRTESAPMNGWRFCKEVASVVNDNMIVIGDGGDIVACASKMIPVHGPGAWMDPGPFGCLGVGVPFAIGARLACPNREILLVMGDGTVGFNGFDFESAVRQNIPFVAVVGNDAAWGQIRGPQVSLLGESAVTATELSRETRYDQIVEAMGGYGERVEEPSEIAAAIRRGFESGKPALIDVQIDRGVLSGGGYMRGF